MVNTVMFIIVLVMILGGAIVVFIRQAREHAEAMRIKDSYLNVIDGQVKEAEIRIKALAQEGKRISTIGSRSIEDAEFLNKVSRTAEDTDMAFLIDAVHRGIYEAILSAPTDALILNAAGKGKGVRMLENTMRNPASIFGGAG